MPLLQAARQAQYAQIAEFKFNMADTMKDVNGAIIAFKNAVGVFEPIPLPNGAVVTGGEVVVETASDDTGTSTIAVGDSAVPARYLAATNLKAAARTPLVPTGFRGAGENLRITLANANGNAVNGTVTVRLEYVITGRMHEVVIA